MADFKTKYPATSSVALTITLASLATSSTRLVGRSSVYVDNTTNLDLDHLLSGSLRVGSVALTANKAIEIWVAAPIKIVTGTPTFPHTFGTDASQTLVNDGQKWAMMQPALTIYPATTTGVDYFIRPISVAGLYGGVLPPFWCAFVTHDTGQNLDSTGSNFYLHYERIQNQSV
jgi:hypothetical protein